MDALLIHGYIRQIEAYLAKNTIIPLDIFNICFEFFFSTKFIFYLAAMRSGNIDHILSVSNMDNKQTFNVKIHELMDPKTSITIKDATGGKKWSMDSAGIAFARNLNLPNSIKHALAMNGEKFKFNNIVFRCAGQNTDSQRTNYCAALIFNSHKMTQTNEMKDIIAYNWKLPNLPRKMSSNFVLYSQNPNELLSIGGYKNYESYDISTANQNNIYRLSFANDSYFEQDSSNWKWTEMNTKLPTNRCAVCAAMICKSTKLIVIGGVAVETTNLVEIYDLTENVWTEGTNRKDLAFDSGIYYDECKELIYVGGGYSDDVEDGSKAMECYDITKDVWEAFPDTVNGHDMTPLIWIENTNLLHIMSISANCIERIDLRELKKWEVINDNLDALFGGANWVKFDNTNVNMRRLVGN